MSGHEVRRPGRVIKKLNYAKWISPSFFFFIKWSTGNHTYHVQASGSDSCLHVATIVFSASIVLKPDLDPKTGWLDIQNEMHNALVLHCGRTALLHIVFLGWMGENFLQHYRTGQLWNSALGSVSTWTLDNCAVLTDLTIFLRICMGLASVVVICSCTPVQCWLFWAYSCWLF